MPEHQLRLSNLVDYSHPIWECITRILHISVILIQSKHLCAFTRSISTLVIFRNSSTSLWPDVVSKVKR